MAKLYGYAGKLLRVDLSGEKISEVAIDEATARKWIGGTGFGAKTLYDEVPASAGWADAGNRLILATGPLGGTTVGGSGTTSVITRGPLTNGAGACQANGFFGAYLHFTGYDGIIIQGKAKKWFYLYIPENGKAELKDASGLLGKDTWETNDAVRAELGASEHGVAVASIGPAGENLVKFASIFFDQGHTASHNGNGAVMGAKKLKAIVVARGKQRPELKDAEKVSDISGQLHDKILNNPGRMGLYNYGTLNAICERTAAKDGIIPVRNYTSSVNDMTPEQLEKFSGPYLRKNYNAKPCPCWACRMHHCHIMTVPDGPYKGFVGEEPEYECFAAFGPCIGNRDAAAAFYLSNVVDRLGMDANEVGWVVGLAIECMEKGVLHPSETDNIKLSWGDVKAADQLIHRIALRQGFGDVLAEGAMRAAQRIGREAPQFAIHTMKGCTPRGHDHRNRWGMLLDTCVSQMGTDEGYSALSPADLGFPDLKPSLNTNYSNEEDILKWNVHLRGAHQFEDSLGTCRFTTGSDIKLLSEAVSAATGWNFDLNEAMMVGKRIINTLRCFNMRCGHTVEMDAPSPRYGSTPVDGPSKGHTIMTNWESLRARFYEGMGWDTKTARPLPETLKKFGLDYAIPELWGKGK
ncbi:MAG: aldehyde ferredoxin oxidoreductase C-terminal domain-containing protein [Chloroflexota bacterium]